MTRAKNPGHTKLRKPASAPVDGLEPVPFQMRLDPELHANLKAVADEAGISLNQLIQGFCRGALANLIIGEPDVSSTGFVNAKKQRGCVFCGRLGSVPIGQEENAEHNFAQNGKYPDWVDPGMVWFGLDFTNRGLVPYSNR